MEEFIELTLFIISIVWFLITTAVFLAYVRVGIQRNQVEAIKKTQDHSISIINKIHMSIDSIKKKA